MQSVSLVVLSVYKDETSFSVTHTVTLPPHYIPSLWKLSTADRHTEANNDYRQEVFSPTVWWPNGILHCLLLKFKHIVVKLSPALSYLIIADSYPTHYQFSQDAPYNARYIVQVNHPLPMSRAALHWVMPHLAELRRTLLNYAAPNEPRRTTLTEPLRTLLSHAAP